MPRNKYSYPPEPDNEPDEDDDDPGSLDDVLTTQRADQPLTVERQAPPAFDPQAQLTQLLQLMETYRDAGMIQQRADGSFMLPGQKNAVWDERLRTGSACQCDGCTPHNQRHWLCMVCGSQHEWVLVNDRPRTMQTRLGQGGVAGYVHLVCSNECALEYRRRMGMGEGVAMVPGVERQIPIAGGEDADPTGFFSTR
jgi:hypothetical protein